MRIRDLYRGEAIILEDQCPAFLLQCNMLDETQEADGSRAAMIFDGP
ncbi:MULTISPECIES: hypothetical protein [Methylobacterium]|nr:MULTISPECIES: hypothetical protein [Methylobacterium]MCI9882710.1 hypothetical protein [Methylobacterium goesingense]